MCGNAGGVGGEGVDEVVKLAVLMNNSYPAEENKSGRKITAHLLGVAV